MKIQRKDKVQLAVAVLTGLLLVMMATAAAAEGRGQRGCDGDGPRLERMTRHLDLTAEQTTAITELRAKGQAANLELRKELRRLRNEKQGEMLKDDPSEKKVLDLTRKMGALQTELQANRAAERLAVRKLLTPEQRDRMLAGGQGRGGKGGACGAGGACGKGQDGHRGRGGRGHR